VVLAVAIQAARVHQGSTLMYSSLALEPLALVEHEHHQIVQMVALERLAAAVVVHLQDGPPQAVLAVTA